MQSKSSCQHVLGLDAMFNEMTIVRGENQHLSNFMETDHSQLCFVDFCVNLFCMKLQLKPV